MIESIKGNRLFLMNRKMAERMKLREASASAGVTTLGSSALEAIKRHQPVFAVYDGKGRLNMIQIYENQEGSMCLVREWHRSISSEVYEKLQQAAIEELLHKSFFLKKHSVTVHGREYVLKRAPIIESVLFAVVFGAAMGLLFGWRMNSIPAGITIGAVWILACACVFISQSMRRQTDHLLNLNT